MNMRSWLIGVAGCLCVFAKADSTWTGLGGNTLWSTSANWAENVAPSTGILTFNTATQLTNQNDITDLSVGSLNFGSSAGAFAINGNEIMLSSALVSTANTTPRINVPLYFTAPISITVSNREVLVDGPIRGQDPIVKLGNSTLTLSGTSIFSGPFYISNGVVRAQANQALGSSSSAVHVSYTNDAKLELANSITLDKPISIYGKSSNNYAIESLGGSKSVTNTLAGEVTLFNQIRFGTSDSVLHFIGGLVAGGTDGNIVVMNSNRGEIRFSQKPIRIGGNKVLYCDNGLVVIAVTNNTWAWLYRSGGEFRTDVANCMPTDRNVQIFKNGILNLNGNDQEIANLYGWGKTNEAVCVTSPTAATLTLNQSLSTTYNGDFSGSLSVRKRGTGTLTIQGTNCTQTGKLILEAGKVQLDTVRELGTAPNSVINDQITLSNATTLGLTATTSLYYPGAITAKETLAATQGITIPTGTGTLEIATGRTLQLDAKISGAGTLNKTGDGILLITNKAALTVPLVISAGTLKTTFPLDPSSRVTIKSGAGYSLLITNATINASDFALENITFQGSAIMTIDSSSAPNKTLTVDGVISNMNGIGLAVYKVGEGTAILTGTNTFTNGVRIVEGTLSIPTFPVLDEASPLGIAATNDSSKLVFAGGILEYSGTETNATTWRRFSYSNSSNTTPISVKNKDALLEFKTYDLCSRGDMLLKLGAGSLKLSKTSGAVANQAMQAVHVLGGTLLSDASPYRIQQNINRLEAVGPALLFGDGAVLRYDTPLQDMSQNGRQLVRYTGTQTRAILDNGLTFCGPSGEPGNIFTFDINDGTDDVDFWTKGNVGLYQAATAYNNVIKAGNGTWKSSAQLSNRGWTKIRAGRMLVTSDIAASGVNCNIGQSTNTYGVLLGDDQTTSQQRPALIYEGATPFRYLRGTYVHTNAFAWIGSTSNVAVTVTANFMIDGILGFQSHTLSNAFNVNYPSWRRWYRQDGPRHRQSECNQQLSWSNDRGARGVACNRKRCASARYGRHPPWRISDCIDHAHAWHTHG